MKTIAVLLMMTSVVGAQCVEGLPCFKGWKPDIGISQPRTSAQGCTVVGVPDVKCDGTMTIVVPSAPQRAPTTSGSKVQENSYTLILRNKRGVTMLIRGLSRAVGLSFDGVTNTPIDSEGRAISQTCERLASAIKASPDIESAECFK